MNTRSFIEALRRLYASYKNKVSVESTLTVADQAEEAEHELHIDHALGNRFSVERRDILVAIHREMTIARNRLIQDFAAELLSPEEYAVGLQRLATETQHAYASALTPAEYQAFFGAAVDEMPELPIDPCLLRNQR